MNTLRNAKETCRYETCPAYCNSLLKVEGLIWPDGSWVEFERQECGCVAQYEWENRDIEEERKHEEYMKAYWSENPYMEDHSTDETETYCDQCGEKMVRSDGGGIWSSVLCVCNKCAPNQGE